MTKQQISVLGAQPFLRGMPFAQLAELAELAELCEHVSISSRQRLFDEGSRADRFWLIDAGQVTLESTLAPACRHRIRCMTYARPCA
jgi:hypothetical protein